MTATLSSHKHTTLFSRLAAATLVSGLGATLPGMAQAQQVPAATDAAKNAPSVRLEPAQVGSGPNLYFYSPGSVTINATRENVPAGATVQWTAKGFSGNVLAQGSLGADAAQTFAVKATTAGIVYVTAVITGADKTELGKGETRFAILKPSPIPAKNVSIAAPLPILYGACAHLGSKPDKEREIALMAALGFRGCRFDYNWGSIQPQRDAWNWTTFDEIFGLLEKYRIEPLPIVAYSARWASTGDPNAKDWHQWNNAPPITADYAHFASESAKHYGRTTRYWEIWNEPDIAFWLGTAEEYAERFDAAKNAIKAVNPKAQVMNGGFSETKRRPDFIPTWMKSSKTQPDIFAYHSHNAFANMLRASDEVKAYMGPEKWTMPVWLNEAGYSSVGKQTERDQAIALVKKMSSASFLGFTGYFLYDIRNDGTNPDENEHNFGLVRQDFAPKAAAVAVHTLLETINGQRFVRRIPVPGVPSAWALLYERPDSKAGSLIVWNETPSTVPLFWRVPAKASRISLMGEQTSLATASGLISLPLTPEPQFVSFTGAAKGIELAGRLLKFDSPITAGPNDTISFRVTLQNPLDKPLKGTLALTSTGGWKADPATIAVDVPAKGSQEYHSNVTAASALGGPQDLQVSITSNALPAEVSAHVPLLSALVVPKRNDTGTLGDFTARTTGLTKRLGRDNIVSLFEATPMQELLFHGEADLSAQVFLASTPKGLSLGVRARDDVFAQNEAPGEEWKGDSLQFAVALPSGETYEWLIALTKTGPIARLNLAPKGIPTGLTTEIPVSVRREGNETLYDLIIPSTLPGGKPLPERFRFSLLVNDNDGAGRKGWLEWTPGIGMTKDPTLFQSLILR